MKSSIHSLAIALVALLFPAFAGFSALAQTGEWPQWRGADRSNASQETNLLKEWPAEGPPLLWRVTGLGDGIHSVSVAGGRVFTVGNREGGEFVFALDAKTGEKLWATRMGDVVAENPLMRWLTQRTPTVDGDRVYAFSSSGELICLGSADGRKVWRRSYPNDFGPSGHPWGFCDRPMVDGEWLICAPLSTKAFITALNKRTGESIWQTRMDYPSSGYGALVATEAGGVKQYVMLSMRGLSAFAADDGRLLWEHPRPMQIAATYTPIAVGEYICSPNGFRGGLLGFQLVPDDTGFAVRDLYWSYAFTFDPFEDSTARVGDYLYILHRPTFKDVSFGTTIVCIELKTGRSIGNSDPASHIGRAALTYADGCLYLRDANGTMTLVQTTPQYRKETGFFKIPDYEKSLGVTAPVVAGGRLYLRDSNRLFCYDISAGALAEPRREPLQVAVGITARELEENDGAPRAPRVGVNRAPDAIYIPTPQDVTERMLEEAGIKKTDVLVDLGSGDGRIVITAAKKYGCRAIGYEIDPRLVELSRKAIAKEHLQELAMIQHADIFTVDLSGADVVTAFLYPRLMERLVPQFEKLKPGSRIVSHQFELPGVKPDRDITVNSEETGQAHRILLWTTPLKKQ